MPLECYRTLRPCFLRLWDGKKRAELCIFISNVIFYNGMCYFHKRKLMWKKYPTGKEGFSVNSLNLWNCSHTLNIQFIFISTSYCLYIVMDRNITPRFLPNRKVKIHQHIQPYLVHGTPPPSWLD